MLGFSTFGFLHETSNTPWNLCSLFPFIHIYDKIWTAFIFSCRPPLQGWRHLRWSPRSPCRTCSSPGCCTCRNPTCSLRWWWSWQTCPRRIWGCSGRRMRSPCRSSARWPLARGRRKCCRLDWEPEEITGCKMHVVLDTQQIVELCVNQIFRERQVNVRLSFILLTKGHISSNCLPCPPGWWQHQEAPQLLERGLKEILQFNDHLHY